MKVSVPEFEPNELAEEFAEFLKVRANVNTVFVSLLRYKLYQPVVNVKKAMRLS